MNSRKNKQIVGRSWMYLALLVMNCQTAMSLVAYQNIDLRNFNASSTTGYKIFGEDPNDNNGFAVSSAGDFNGDGFDDFIVGARGTDYDGPTDRGSAYLIFGKVYQTVPNIDLSTFTSGAVGFRMGGPDGGQCGTSVSSAGDFNNDGYDDLLVGCPFAPAETSGGTFVTNGGITYVVFGTSTAQTQMTLPFLSGSSDGFAIHGPTAQGKLGSAVSAAGDVNGDGYSDIIIGAPFAGSAAAGIAYVLFGHGPAWPHMLLYGFSSGSNGFKILGTTADDRVGFSVSSAGDVNGDGYDDVMVGVAPFEANVESVKVFVIYGHSTGTTFTDVTITSVSSIVGFAITTGNSAAALGPALSSVRDCNGDGLSDIVIGVSETTYNRNYAGYVAVIFGRRSGLANVNPETAGLAAANTGYLILGAAANNGLGSSVSGAGDINEDGLEDIIVGSLKTAQGRTDAGTAFVFFSRNTSVYHAANIDLLTFSTGTRGFKIYGAFPSDHLSVSISRAGDVDGDGIPDLLIGAPDSDPSERSAAGTAYVIFGRIGLGPSPYEDIDIDTFTSGSKGFRIWGVDQNDRAGTSVSGGFDFNGDSFGDVVVGGSTALRSGRTTAGAAFVILGSSSAVTYGNVDLYSFAASGVGFQMIGEANNDQCGTSVSGIGDFDHDGFDDIIVGAALNDGLGTRTDSGTGYVVYGDAASRAFTDFQSFPTAGNGFRAVGGTAYDYFASSASAAGDVNGDGTADFLVGASGATSGATSNAGHVYLVYGIPSASLTSLDFGSLGSNGVRIEGVSEDDQLGYSVSAAGDVNGDNFGDFIIGSGFANTLSRSNNGAAYLLFGDTSLPTVISLNSLGSSRGISINGPESDHHCGRSVSGGGDINGDGYHDVLVGCYKAYCSGMNEAGAVYAIFGHSNAVAFATIDLLGFVASQSGGFKILGASAYTSTGISVSFAGDVNADGIDDLILGASTYDYSSRQESGAAFIIFGQPRNRKVRNIDLATFTSGYRGFQVFGGFADDHLGISVSMAGDVNGDGADDVIIGAPDSFPDSRPYAGEAYVIFGISTALPTQAPTSQPSREPSSQPSRRPSRQPSRQPSSQPSTQPTRQPSTQPVADPTSQPSGRPSRQPTSRPTAQPSMRPSRQPSRQPSGQPSSRPTAQPSVQPSLQPAAFPSSQPSRQPTRQPSRSPSCQPSAQPSAQPAARPSAQPTRQPTRQPSVAPSCQPSGQPSAQPAARPSAQPSRQPSSGPTSQPSRQPTCQPSVKPSCQPSQQPSRQPSANPSRQPSARPSVQPTNQPSRQPTGQPTMQPSGQPSVQPTRQPSSAPSSQPTCQPSRQPTQQPTQQPAASPSAQPTAQPSRQPSSAPSRQPSRQPSAQPTQQPSCQPSCQPSRQPSSSPSCQPSVQPSAQPVGNPTSQPSRQPSSTPTAQPSADPSSQPSRQPSRQPSARPSDQPSVQPSLQPSARPSTQPTRQPTSGPTRQPSAAPSSQPSRQPSRQPSSRPSSQPSRQPSSGPTSQPSGQPSAQPAGFPTSQPSRQPTSRPSVQPSKQPSAQPSIGPSTQPSSQPSSRPTVQPTGRPTCQPSRQPSLQPSGQPSNQPSAQPFSKPTLQPSGDPSCQPSWQPSAQPSAFPSAQPSHSPTSQPSGAPTCQPSRQPSKQPTSSPSAQPTGAPTAQPSAFPSSQPSRQPTRQPTSQPTVQPSTQPTGMPTSQPSIQPSSQPTRQPTCRPSAQPSVAPSSQPSHTPSTQPTEAPSGQPSACPSTQPSTVPTVQPTGEPSSQPSATPSVQPSIMPSSQPSSVPTVQPSGVPTAQPSGVPSTQPSVSPTSQPSSVPSAQPSALPSCQPTNLPSSQPSFLPSTQPSVAPTSQPTGTPSSQPSGVPSSQPTAAPTSRPSVQPSAAPSAQPSLQPTSEPSGQPSAQPSMEPSSQPTAAPSTQPSGFPSGSPSGQPSTVPSALPTTGPTVQPSCAPTCQPSVRPTNQPTCSPSSQPLSSPSAQPSAMPSGQPSSRPSAQPSNFPSSMPSTQPTCAPTAQPLGLPSAQPTAQPSKAFNASAPDTAPNVTIASVSAQRTSISVQVHLLDKTGVNVYCAALATSTRSAGVSASTIRKLGKFKYAATATVALNITQLFPATSYDVYCMSVTLQGAEQPQASIKRSLVTTATACCKSLFVNLQVASTYQNQATLNGMWVSSDAPPSEYLDVSFPFSMISGAQAAQTYPTLLRLSNFSQATLSQSASVIGGGEGVHQLRVVLSGLSRNEFQVVYTGRTTLTVLAVEASPEAPALVSATFSPDGSAVIATFDAPTDQGGFSNIFPCSSLLHFVGIHNALCQWTSTSSATIFPQYSRSEPRNVLVVGGNVTLMGDSVRAACPPSIAGALCSAWLPQVTTTVLIAAPDAPTAPTVVISMPASLSACSALVLDITNSAGAAGRPWRDVKFRVLTSTGTSVAAAQLERFLTRNYTTVAPTVVPHTAFEKDQVYSVQVTLCNFLGACASAEKSVMVSSSQAPLPVVSILGLSQRSVYRPVQVVINSNAYTQSCGGAQSFTGLRFEWSMASVSTAGGPSSPVAIVSISQSPSVFKLPAYSLTAGNDYEITLTVTSTASALSASAKVTVSVLQSPLVAKVSGASIRNVMAGELLCLDASTSYDSDVAEKTGVEAGLSFAWTCVQLEPTFGPTCPYDLSSAQSVEVTATPQGSALGTTAQVTLTVSDGAGRTSSAHVTVIVSNAAAPTLQIVPAATTVTNVNTGAQLVLYGTVQSSVPCVALWSVDDPAVALQDVSRTPVTKAIAAGNTPVPVNLVLMEGALPQRSALSFRLSCDGAFTSLVVTTNGAPLPGEFSVHPDEGVELRTVFSFAALQWSDVDFPLTYQFGFESATSLSNLVVVSKSEYAYTSSSLPAGSDVAAHKVNCTMAVFDTYSAFTERRVAVSVDPLPIVPKQESLLKLVQSNTGSVDSTKNIISVVSSALNSVNCTTAPNCTERNRSPCVKTTGECGACLPGYIGDAGDRSTPCISVIDIQTAAATPCIHRDDCLFWQICDAAAKQCVAPMKTCAQNCSSHGTCMFTNRATGERAESCRLDDVSCDGVCICAGGFSGLSCEISVEVLQSRRELRSNLIQALGDLTGEEDINSQSVSSWSASLYSLSINPYELSSTDISNVETIANHTLYQAIALGVDSYETLVGVLQATDTVASLLKYNYNPNHYTSEDFATPRGYVNNTAAGTISVVKPFGDLIARNLVLGQNRTTLLYDNFRLSVDVQSITAGSELSLETPQSAFEVGAGQESSSARLSSKLDYGPVETTAVALKMIAVYPRSYVSDTSGFVSNPVLLQVQSHGKTSIRPEDYLSTVEFTFQHLAEQANYIDNTVVQFVTVCNFSNAAQSFTHVCPSSGHVLMHNCSQGAGVHTSYCPKPTPACAAVDIATATATLPTSCRVQSFSAYHTTCVCDVTAGAATTEALGGAARSLQVATEAAILDDSGAANMMASTIFIAEDFADTFEASNDFNSPGDAQRVLVVIILMSVLWVPGLLIVFAEHVAPAQAKKKLSKDKQALAMKESVLKYVETVIPGVFTVNATFGTRLWPELLAHHMFFKIFAQTGRQKRRETICKTLTILTFMLFLTAVFFDVSNPGDDGTCGHYGTADACVERTSPFDGDQSYCLWVDSDEHDPYCAYNSQNLSMRAMFYLTVLTTVITAIATIPLDYLFSIIKAPTARSLKGAKVADALKAVAKGARRLSSVGVAAVRRASVQAITPLQKLANGFKTPKRETIIANREIPEDFELASELARQALPQLASNAKEIAAQSQRLSLAMKSRSARRSQLVAPGHQQGPPSGHNLPVAQQWQSDSDGNEGTRPAGGTSELDELEGQDHSGSSIGPPVGLSPPVLELFDDVLAQRVLMNDRADETTLFDTQWGLHHRATGKSYELSPSARATLAEAVEDAVEESARLSKMLPNYSIQHAGLEILHLFMVDLLGRTTPAAIIFQEKFGEEFGNSKIVVMAQKYAAAIVLLCLNGFFAYYIMLKAFQKGLHWQLQYLVCCILQLVVEVFVFETTECIWLNVSVPSFVHKEVARAAAILNKAVDKVTSPPEAAGAGKKTGQMAFFLNAPAHLFVSTRIAQEHPLLLESVIVSSYAHHLPGEICRTWPHCRGTNAPVEEEVSAQQASKARFPMLMRFARSANLAVQVFITIPYLYQRVIIRFVQPIILSGISIVWYVAIKSITSAIALGGVTAFVLIAFLWRRHLQRRHQQRTESSVVPGLEVPQATNTGIVLASIPVFVEDLDDAEGNEDSSSSSSTASRASKASSSSGEISEASEDTEGSDADEAACSNSKPASQRPGRRGSGGKSAPPPIPIGRGATPPDIPDRHAPAGEVSCLPAHSLLSLGRIDAPEPSAPRSGTSEQESKLSEDDASLEVSYHFSSAAAIFQSALHSVLPVRAGTANSQRDRSGTLSDIHVMYSDPEIRSTMGSDCLSISNESEALNMHPAGVKAFSAAGSISVSEQAPSGYDSEFSSVHRSPVGSKNPATLTTHQLHLSPEVDYEWPSDESADEHEQVRPVMGGYLFDDCSSSDAEEEEDGGVVYRISSDESSEMHVPGADRTHSAENISMSSESRPDSDLLDIGT